MEVVAASVAVVPVQLLATGVLGAVHQFAFGQLAPVGQFICVRRIVVGNFGRVRFVSTFFLRLHIEFNRSYTRVN